MAVTPNYSQGIATGDLTLDNIYNRVIKIGRSVIRGIETTDPLDVFNKAPLNNGEVLEEVIVKLVESNTFAYDDVNAKSPLATRSPDLAVRYYKDWTAKTFETGISRNEARKITLAGDDVETLAGRVATTLVESDKQEKYENMRDMFAWGVTNKIFVNKGTIPPTNYKGILNKLKDVISEMKFTNTTCNTAGIKRKTLVDDIYVIMPYKIKNAIDVNELAGVFNLDKAEIGSRIIEIDSGDNIYIVDRNAIISITRLYLMTDMLNPQTLNMSYFLNTERLLAISPLWDGCYIEVKEGQ